MLKRSLLTVAILGVFAAAAAHGEVEVEKAKSAGSAELELELESPLSTCRAVPNRTEGKALVESLLPRQNASGRDESEPPRLFARGWGGGSSWCLVCNGWVCWRVRC